MSRLLLILFIVFGCSKITLNDVSSDESSIVLDYRAYKGNGLSNFYIDHDGLRREFFLYIPNSIGSKKNPVIFNFHGYSGQAQQFFNYTDLVEISETNGIILVYPQGALLNGVTHWNAAPNGNISTLNKSNVDDLGFFNAMLEEINQDDLNGISWTKGCFMGQEITARMKYRNIVKKKIFKVRYFKNN